MILNELFNKTSQWKWVGRGSEWFAEFWIGRNKYITMVEKNGDASSEVAFTMVDENGEFRDDITGAGNPFEVFATVFEIVQDFIKQNPDVTSLNFSAEEDSRKKLYTRFVKGLVKQGWTAEVRGNRYYVTKPTTD